MSENILVVEYEPRYTDRVKQALAGQPFTTTFARDGEEAMKALEDEPRLIVLSSVVPKISTTELIRAIRGRKPLQETPILLTVSGYNGKSPKQDAQRVGASDILPKPYSEHEFLGKIQQMLGIRGELPPFEDFTVHPSAEPALTSNDIFGDLLEEDKPAKKTTHSRPGTGDVDKMLADTLAGMNVPRRKDHAPPSAPAAGTPAPQPQAGAQTKPRTMPGSGSADLDKRLQDTLSGLEKSARKVTSPGTTPRPATPVPPPAPPATPAPAPSFNTEKMKPYVADRVPVSQPVFATPEAPREEEEVTDGVKFGQYVMIDKIATGGMAEVWKARMRGVEGFQKTVAIKKILPHLSDNQDFIEMFVDEAKLAAQLNHNNIIHIYDLGKIQNSYYIAMEYIDGFDLKAILRRGEERGQPMEPQLALFIASKIASALDYAHRKRDFEEKEMGLVHRDVSPQNVLISQEGDIKLCDFGIAKAASKASHTQAGALKGKLQYMSPEQAWGRSIDRRSDIFALATVLFEMLTGRKLFTGDNELSILEQVREARVTPPSEFNDEVTEDIDRIVLKALQKDPANRYQTAGEMARDIDAVLYNFKPTPTSADLAIYMHRMSTTEPLPVAEPEPIFAPAAVPTPPPAPKPVMPAFTPVAAAAAAPVAAAAPAVAHHPEPWEQQHPPAAKKGSAMPLIAIGVVLLLAGGAGAFVMMRNKPDAAPAAAVSTRPATATTAAATPATATVVPLSTDTALTGTTGTAIDPSLVDQEVQKRIAAERARLEALARQQQQAATATVAQARPVPPPIVAETRPVQQEAPAPVETRPTPAPVTQTQEAAPQQAAPAPVQQAPAQTTRVREGDLVPVGTEGLTPPRMTRRGTVTYPPVAARQKIGGTVLTNVLVSETGSVIRVDVLRGVNRPVGLNEAAQEAMRRSSFAPATKDGVRVKSWVTVPVDFKP